MADHAYEEPYAEDTGRTNPVFAFLLFCFQVGITFVWYFMCLDRYEGNTPV